MTCGSRLATQYCVIHPVVLVAIFVGVAIAAYFVLARFLAPTADARPPATPDWRNDLRARLGLVEISPGVWRSRAELDEEQAALEKWRASLEPSGILGVEGAEIAFRHPAHAEPERMTVMAVLYGKRYWVDGWCLDRAERRTIPVGELGQVVTSDGAEFEDGWQWLLHRGEISPELAAELGMVLPLRAEPLHRFGGAEPSCDRSSAAPS